MAYNEETLLRIRSCFKLFPPETLEAITEKKMFGGVAFLHSGKMTVGIIGDELVVRILDSKMPEMLKMANVRPMDFTKKPMKEFIFVSPDGFKEETQLHQWITLGLEHAAHKLKTNH